jgi:hypothetical protein
MYNLTDFNIIFCGHKRWLVGENETKILHNQNCNLLKTINQNFSNDNVDNVALESTIKNKNYKKLSQKLTKIRFFTTKIAVYYSKLTKILNGEWNE